MFKKLNNDWIPIERVEDEHLEENDYKPSFWFFNRRKFLENFTEEFGVTWEGPEYIHAMEKDVYVKPLFIEYNDTRDAVNVYQEIEEPRKMGSFL